jgi:hypothetical protein
MNPKVRLALLLLLSTSLFAPVVTKAQIASNLSAYTGQNVKGYLQPLEEGFGSLLNTGAFRSAHIPRSGFNINLEVKTMALKFNDSDRTFTATTEEGFYPEVQVEAPTVIGGTAAVEVPGTGGTTAALPGGLDIKSMAMAAPQLTIGSIMGTQAVLRFFSLNSGDTEIGDVKLFGLGARHSISQYLPNFPIDLAAGLLWQHFKMGSKLIDANALTAGVQASRRFSLLEPYAGLSLDRFSMKTEYTSKEAEPPTKFKVDFDPKTTGRFTAGLGLNLLVVHLQGEIDLSSRTSYLLGLSLGN